MKTLYKTTPKINFLTNSKSKTSAIEICVKVLLKRVYRIDKLGCNFYFNHKIINLKETTSDDYQIKEDTLFELKPKLAVITFMKGTNSSPIFYCLKEDEQELKHYLAIYET